MLKTIFLWLFGLVVALIILALGGLLWFTNGVDAIYGAHTEEVDQTAFASPQERITISNVNVLSEDGLSMLANRTVVVDGGHIVSITQGGVAPYDA